MRTGELSKHTGASPRSPRHQEAQGLLTSSRPGRAATVARWPQQLFGAGLSSRVIATVLPCVQAPAMRA
ncbi:hypothetical protein [Sciscionella sediminilitoris]|uniref:hypothetical protein n=1 Tax=Sciscionella sediminilitoris TaxID=1445613 RepID=UPI000691A220|nr:hypothetical protein [Sciscionella sp. SE31]